MASPMGIDEGEIVESGSDKANTSPPSAQGLNVDRPSRSPLKAASLHDSNDEADHRPRGRTRSPYASTDSRDRKRGRDTYQDYGYDGPVYKSNSRQLKVAAEDRLSGESRRARVSYADLDYGPDVDEDRRHRDDSFDDRRGQKRQRTRSRSPTRRRAEYDDAQRTAGAQWGDARRARDRGQGAEKRRIHTRREEYHAAQSVSEQGYKPVPLGLSRHEAKSRMKGDSTHRDVDQTLSRFPRHREVPSMQVSATPTETQSARSMNQIAADDTQAEPAPLDEAALIEQRRKKREAIKAKYRGQATPLLVQALQLGSMSGPGSPPSSTARVQASASITPGQDDGSATPDRERARDFREVAPELSPISASQDMTEPASPAAFSLKKDEDLADEFSQAFGGTEQEGASAADYDPTMDMREDRQRDDERHHMAEVPSSAHDETVAAQQDGSIPVTESSFPPDRPSETKDDFDMFADDADDDDVAASTATGLLDGSVRPTTTTTTTVPGPTPKTLHMGMLDDWDDPEGYYKTILGELLDSRYHVQSLLGRGMFSSVVRCLDTQNDNAPVAIKLIRNNETMRKAGMKEIAILNTLNAADADDRKHLVRLLRHFDHKSHLCMVFESLSINLREVLKKFGRDVGINLKAVRAYATQMFLALGLLKKCNILHADLKPDNILINESRSLLKVCDLGSACDASDNEITPYLVSRFYRAPEIILGIPYDAAIDVWSIGCTLFELYTGKILFTGRTNNQMLRSIMECRGRFSLKLLRRAEFAGLHFDEMGHFRSVEKDKLTGRDVMRTLPMKGVGTDGEKGKGLKSRVMAAMGKNQTEAEGKEISALVDLLEKCLTINGEKRITPSEALKHPFISGRGGSGAN